ncbi:hypothetical protein HMF7854_04525 [Sphingomonas ginkgonis]|uniref:Uncharacterized protein n=1 Tax=Sphingomonas ginkgonis TaxID=2315330 RepID=A0A3S0EL75_9SPHN|nr:hypothetical protein [Sphingomonas ginkgonis]RST30174.1 hypothetical protein HMF7854_04525 [Sphingomonas ginkgonis]
MQTRLAGAVDHLRVRLVDDVHCSWRWATTWLNLAGTAVLTYALEHEAVVNTLLPFLPASLKPYSPILGLLWGVLVQAARSMKQQRS